MPDKMGKNEGGMIFLLPERSGFAILKEDRIVEDNVMDEQSKGFRGVVFGGF